MKFFHLLLFALFYGSIYGSQESCCEEILNACHNSLHDQNNANYDGAQTFTQNCLLWICCGGNDEKNQQSLLNDGEFGIQNNENANALAMLESLLKETEDETTENIQSDQNGRCLFCQFLYKKDNLAFVVHTQPGMMPHYSFCFLCLCESPRLYATAKCLICRQDVADVKECLLFQDWERNMNQPRDNMIQPQAMFYDVPPVLNQNPIVIPNLDDQNNVLNHIRVIYDGGMIPTSITFFAMGILSTSISAANKAFGDVETNGEYQYQLIFNLQELSRDAWWFLWCVSLAFIYENRKAATFLFDKRGYAYLTLPLITSFVTATGRLDIAAWFNIIPLVFYFGDMYTATRRIPKIISSRMAKFCANQPQLYLKGINQEYMQNTTLCQSIQTQLWYNLQYWNVMGSVFLPIKNFQMVKDGYKGLLDSEMKYNTIVGIACGNALMALAILIHSHVVAYKKNEPIMNIKQVSQFFLSIFAVYHGSPILLNSFLIFNFFYSLLVVSKFLHSKLCPNSCSSFFENNNNNQQSI